MSYAKDKDGNLLLDKETGTPVWCGSAASRLEHYRKQSAPELVKENEALKERIAYFERKYGRFETKEWKEAIERDDQLYIDRVGRKSP